MKKAAIALLMFILMMFCCGCNQEAKCSKPDIEQVRSICNLATLECYYHNVAKSKKNAGSGFYHIGEVDRKYWIEYTGIVKIGIDVSKVSMKINDNRVEIYIPQAEVLSEDILDDDLSVDSCFVESDSWFNANKITADDQSKAVQSAQEEMVRNAQTNKVLLLTAQNSAKKIIENYIDQVGKLSNVKYEIEWKYEDDSSTNIESSTLEIMKETEE